MSFELRPYQNEIIDRTRAAMLRGSRSLLIVSPTGSGKTALTAHMLSTASSKGMPSLFVVHRRELVKQSIRTFTKVGVRHGIIAAGFYPEKAPLVQIASVQTLARRWQDYRKPALIVWDECHHVAAKGWSDIHKALPEAYHVGLTATPQRLDGRGLGAWFKEMIDGPQVAWLIENGFLSRYKMFAPPGISTVGMHTRYGDFVKSEMESAADRPTITGDAIKHYLKHAAGKRAVVFCVSVEHSKHVVEQFRSAGVEAAHVDGETNVDERDRSIARFESGQIKVLSNVELFGEGFDLPAIEVAILLRPTASLGLYLQQVGRALRPSPGKESAIILDHAGNCERHGLPDEERVWSLDGRGSGKGDGASAGSVKVCPKCFAAQFSGAPKCKLCGHVFEVNTAARQVENVDGELVEVDAEALRRKRNEEQKGARTEDELVEIGKRRGYKRPHAWARHILLYRKQREAERRAGI